MPAIARRRWPTYAFCAMSLSKEKLEGLISRSTAIIIATGRKGRIIYYNDGASRSLGYTPEEILGSFVATAYPDVEEAKRVMRAMRGPDHGGIGIVETFQTTFLSKDGQHIPVAMSATITYDESGEPDGTIGYAKDLREILRKDKLATLGEVAVGLSHEINNPLAVILNLLDLLEREIDELAGEQDSSVEFERTPRDTPGSHAYFQHPASPGRNGRDPELRDDQIHRADAHDRPSRLALGIA